MIFTIGPELVSIDFDEPEPPKWRLIKYHFWERRRRCAFEKCMDTNLKILEDFDKKYKEANSDG